MWQPSPDPILNTRPDSCSSIKRVVLRSETYSTFRKRSAGFGVGLGGRKRDRQMKVRLRVIDKAVIECRITLEIQKARTPTTGVPKEATTQGSEGAPLPSNDTPLREG